MAHPYSSKLNGITGTALEGWDDEGNVRKREKLEHLRTLESEAGENAFEIHIPSHDDIKQCKPTRFNTLIVSPVLLGVQCVPSMRKPRVRKGDLGKLSRMLDLPVEVFCHIASYMEPLDLLYLARTSCELRSFLMSKSSKSVWNASILAINLPACPLDLSAPQYINILFEKGCHGCGRTRATHTLATLRIRLCHDCESLNVIRGRKLAVEAFGIPVSEIQEIYSLLPWSCMPIYGDAPARLDFAKAHGNNSFLRYDFLSVVSDYLNTKPNSDEREAFVKRRHELVLELVEVKENVRAVSKWERKCREDREEADETVRVKRKEQVEERLQMLGYSKEDLEAMSYVSYALPSDEKQLVRAWARLISQPKELTERSWKSLRPKLEVILQDKLRRQRERLRKQNLEKRKAELLNHYKTYALYHRFKDTLVTLCFTDLCEVPMVRTLIEESDYSLEMTTSRWALIHDELPHLIQDHYKKVQSDCGALLLIALRRATKESNLDSLFVPNAPNSPDILSRAYAYFGTCRELDPPSTFYDVARLRHRRLFDTKDWGPWDPTRIQIEVLITQAACALLSSLGFPEETTMQEMEELGLSLVCSQCHPAFQNRMSWSFLVSHLCSEVKKYREKAPIFQEKGLPWRESHKVVLDGTELAFYDPNFSQPSIHLYSDVDPTHKNCPHCRRVDIKRSFRYEEQYLAHMQNYHGVQL